MNDTLPPTTEPPNAEDAPNYVVGDLRQRATKSSAEEFSQLLQHHVLISAPVNEDGDQTDEWAFRTGSFTAVRDDETGFVIDLPDDHEVRLLRKRDDALFRDTILIGRAETCDVVIRDPSISKLHARIKIAPSVPPRLSDAGSSNGTRLDQLLLTPDDSVALPDAGVLTLGTRVFHVIAPQTFHRILLKLDRALS